MIWYNTDKTKFIDLSKIGYWDYSPEHIDGFQLGAALIMSIEGYEVGVINEEAKEIYQLLIQEKNLLKG